MNPDAVAEAIRRLVSHLDYDLYKEIELAEDVDDYTWSELTDIFVENYEKAEAELG